MVLSYRPPPLTLFWGITMKKLLLTIGLISLLTISALEAKQIGDFNGDGNINILDVMEFLNYLGGNKDIEEMGQDISASSYGMTDFNSVIIPEISLGSEGENEVINDNNIDDVHAILLRQIFDSWMGARSQLDDYVITTFAGPHSGTATFYGTLGGNNAYDFMNVEVLFEDYSRDGEIYISGKFYLGKMGSYTPPYPPDSPIGFDDVYLMGNCHITGRYRGYMWYHCKVARYFDGIYYGYNGAYYTARKKGDGSGSHGSGGPLTIDNSDWVIPDDWQERTNGEPVKDSILVETGVNR